MDGGLIYLAGFLLVLLFVWLLSAEIRALLGRRRARNGTYRTLAECERVIDELSKRLTREPRSWEIYVRRGEAFAFLGDHQQAIRDFTRALSVRQEDASILVRRGRSYYKLRKFDEAIWDCTRALANNPHYIPAYGLRGQAYFGSDA
jgi:tetratricopeptide (TPR) repeat protein